MLMKPNLWTSESRWERMCLSASKGGTMLSEGIGEKLTKIPSFEE